MIVEDLITAIGSTSVYKLDKIDGSDDSPIQVWDRCKNSDLHRFTCDKVVYGNLVSISGVVFVDNTVATVTLK